MDGGKKGEERERKDTLKDHFGLLYIIGRYHKLMTTPRTGLFLLAFILSN